MESVKRAKFLSEVIGDKPVNDIPGVGFLLGHRFTLIGYSRASDVLKKFLMMDKDEAMFMHWMQDSVRANEKQSRQCVESLQAYCQRFP